MPIDPNELEAAMLEVSDDPAALDRLVRLAEEQGVSPQGTPETKADQPAESK